MILGVAMFQILTLRAGHRWGDDFAMYIHHAKNIAEGIPYADTGYIYNTHTQQGPATYPPVFPLLLAPVYKAFGLDLGPMKVEVVVFFAGALLLFGLLLRTELPPPVLLAFLVILGFSPFFWQAKDDVLSDFPFLFFLALSLLLIHRAPDWERRFKWRPLYPIGTGAALYLAVGTRPVGLALVPTLLAADWVRNRRLTRMTFVPLAVLIVLLGLQSIFVHGGGGYLDQLLPTPASVGRNVAGYARALQRIWQADRTGAELPVLYWVLAALTITGFVMRLRRGVTVIEIWPVMYCIPILLWHSRPVARYLIPWIPFFVFFALVGAVAVGVFLRKKLGVAGSVILPAILVVGILLTYARVYARTDFGPIAGGPTSPAAGRLWSFVKDRTSEQDVFVFIKPRALSLFTGRPASAYYEPKDERELWAYVREIHARYVIVGPLDHAYLRRFVRSYQHELTEVFSVGQFVVYDVAP
ncbi:MAG TPA: hypothetical protein VGR13_08340 [Actinomycetota bacterium]|nr:hypothetical protein [Actinomycetota bacterium]